MGTKIPVYGTGTSKHIRADREYMVSEDEAARLIKKGVATDKMPKGFEKKVVTTKTAEKKTVTKGAAKKKTSGPTDAAGPGTITTNNLKKDGDDQSNG
jgi:hypothetical protein